jgi:hypothetical protein
MGVEKSSAGGSMTFVKILTPKNDKVPAACFGTAKKNEATGKYDYADAGDTLSGRLVTVTQDSYEYDGETKRSVALTFSDGGERFKLEMNHSWRTSSLLNSLATAPDFSHVELGVYEDLTSKSRDKVRFKIRVNGERPEWMHAKGEGSDDASENIDTYVGAILGKLPKGAPVEEPTKVTPKPEKAPAPAGHVDDLDDDGDGLPF